MLAACGGGGGTGTTSAPPGSFTLSTTNVSFSAKRLGPAPAGQTITMHLTSTGAATAGAGYANGVTAASWLTVGAAGSGSDYTFTLTVNTTALTSGSYSTVLTLGTADASNNILQTQAVQVSYSVHDGLLINATSVGTSFTVGDSLSSGSLPFMVSTPAAIQWTAQSNSPWLTGPTGTQQGSGSFSANVNMAGMGAGTYTGKITVTNTADPTDTASINVIITLVAPIMTVGPTGISLGGTTGLDTSAQTLTFSINTNLNAYAWTATPTTSTGGAWLNLSASTGMVSGSNVTVTVNANRSLLAAGTYQGQIQLQTTVNGSVLTQNIPVTLNVDPNRLVATATGVAFSSFPSRSVLTRTLNVANTWGVTGVHWQTQSDQSWLTATTSGTTGSPLVLTANPTGMTPGQYTAHLTITSPDSGVSNQETVRVGLTVGSTDPAPLITLASENGTVMVTSPVEPVAFISTGAANAPIRVYDLNTGTLLNTFTNGFTTPGSLAISGDGLTLYVLDNTSPAAIRTLDATTGALLQGSYPAPSDNQSAQIAYVRPDGHALLFCPRADVAIDLASSATYPITSPVGFKGYDDAMAASPDQGTLYMMLMNISPANIASFKIVYSTLPGVGLSFTQIAQIDETMPVTPSNGMEIAVSPDGTTVYSASGAPYDFEVFNTAIQRQTPLPAAAYPTSVTTSWNGLIAGGSVSYNAAGDIWFYDTQGILLEETHPDPNGTLGIDDRGLKFSGDGTRLASIGGAGLQIYATPIPPP